MIEHQEEVKKKGFKCYLQNLKSLDINQQLLSLIINSMWLSFYWLPSIVCGWFPLNYEIFDIVDILNVFSTLKFKIENFL